ncbi:sarcosine oxidase subunit gamma [Puniceibacterium sediminis]|uniref:Sarcosine oxidase subunit gamma n=1 Tax=Puniceibacterium sediminis TaxID=1608407 RepID=A0A238UXI1_9RHOB|nr:sarcosine oxidase subunit gamma family protein [Puniceibacterium sediminis]SNR26895.1 sarcosine oxidase subunit gamma [Puniceibacterium sediminis]
MSEPVSALNAAAFDGLAHVQEAGLHGMITLRGDHADADFAQAVADVAGVAMPDQREVVSGGDTSLIWMSPDELLLLCPYAEAGETVTKLTEALGDTHALAVDVSDARVVFTLTGTHIRDVIAKLAPVDMSPAAFRPGMVRRTRFAQVAAAVWLRDDETAQIICFRSVAPYMFALLCNAATPGTEVGIF